MIFIKYYLEGHTLHQCALSTGMDYKHTAVNWASYIRELFCQFVFDTYNMMNFEGEVEIDESLFGRKVKYNKGQPRGHRIWIFGIVERASNKIILYPVDNRSADTLIPLIQRHVYPGSRIYSDSWASYMGLNELGYEHFTVVHKTNFKQRYRNVDTGETVDCHTNRIEGAWKLCKDHFRRINGSNTKLFEQHIAEIVWRNHTHRENLYESFFSLLKSVYSLSEPPKYTYRKPVFDTWTPPSERDEREHHITIVQESDTDSSDSDSNTQEQNVSSSQEHSGSNGSASNVQSVNERTHSAELSDQSFKSTIPLSSSTPASVLRTSSDHTASRSPQPSTSNAKPFDDKFVTKRKKKKVPSENKSDWEFDTSATKQAYPTNFEPIKRKEKKKKAKTAITHPKKNPYSKSAYLYEMSSDSDFQ